MDIEPTPGIVSLYDLHLDGATLVIDHVRFKRVRGDWVRHEVHSVVGHEPERWSLFCTGPDDHSDLKGPPGPQDLGCKLCARCVLHSKALHRWHLPVDPEDDDELTLEL